LAAVWGEVVGRKMNVVQTMYTHICRYKNDTCRSSKNQGREDGGEPVEGEEFKCEIFDTL
jgi:hypothetical protein